MLKFFPVALISSLLAISTSAQVNTTDSLALVALYNSTDGANWTTPWDLSQPVSTWNGITLTGDRVTNVNLLSQNMNGTIPSEIGDLTELTQLTIAQSNNISGGMLPVMLLLWAIVKLGI